MNFTEAVELAKKKEETGYKFLYEHTFKKIDGNYKWVSVEGV